MAAGRRRLHDLLQHMGHNQHVCRLPNLLRVWRALRGFFFRHLLDWLDSMLFASTYWACRWTDLRQRLPSSAPLHWKFLGRLRFHDALSVPGILAGIAGTGLLHRHRRRVAFYAHRVTGSDVLQHEDRPRGWHCVVRLLARRRHLPDRALQAVRATGLPLSCAHHWLYRSGNVYTSVGRDESARTHAQATRHDRLVRVC